ncbi:MAG: hypothetical protein ACRDRZ_05720, partial [Pseudonocardiaceae bacterium]
MSVRRATAVVAAAAVLLLAAAPPAAADVVLDPADAEDLAGTLADATAAQGVCYGWTVRVDDQGTGSDSGTSTGSNFGPGVSLASRSGSCPRQVEFVAAITYTSESSESEDSVSFQVTSTTPGRPDPGALTDLGIIDDDSLAGDAVDAAVARAVTALPQLAADAGLAPPLVATPRTSAPPDVGSLSDDPGSDYLRRAGGLLAFGLVLLVGGLAFGGVALATS